MHLMRNEMIAPFVRLDFFFMVSPTTTTHNDVAMPFCHLSGSIKPNHKLNQMNCMLLMHVARVSHVWLVPAMRSNKIVYVIDCKVHFVFIIQSAS